MLAFIVLFGLFAFAGTCHLYRLWSEACARSEIEAEIERRASQLARDLWAQELRHLRLKQREFKQ